MSREFDPDLLRAQRARRQMTQWDLALDADLSIGTVRGLEQGRHRVPTPRTLRKLAKALGCAVGDLLTSKEATSTPGPQ
jgi:transcriptional regulator with XRE-family HTH domain